MHRHRLLVAVALLGAACGDDTGESSATTTTQAVDLGAAVLTTIEVDEFVFDQRRHQIRSLGEAGYRVIAPDQRGYSAGARPTDVADGFTIGPITVPTMFIWSTGDDFLGPDPAAITGDYVEAGYRFEIIHDVDHWVPEVASDIVNPLLLDFLAEPGAVAAGEQVTTEHGAG